MPYSIAELNQMHQEPFVEAIGTVFENTPSIAAAAWTERPFHDVAELHATLVRVMQALSPEKQLALIQAHPDLAGKVKMAEASVKEQSGAGLDRLSPDEFERFQQLNQAYKQKFGFPFIIAVRNHTKDSILAAFEQRLHHSVEVEMQQALTEITHITQFRLFDLVESGAA